jgi:hypothetical protein
MYAIQVHSGFQVPLLRHEIQNQTCTVTQQQTITTQSGKTVQNKEGVAVTAMTYMKNTLVMMYSMDKKVLEFFRTHTELDYTCHEIARAIGVEWTRSVHQSIKRLMHESKVIPIRELNYNRWTYQLPEWLDDKKHNELNTIG